MVNQGSCWASCQGSTAPNFMCHSFYPNCFSLDIVFNVSSEGLPGKMIMWVRTIHLGIKFKHTLYPRLQIHTFFYPYPKLRLIKAMEIIHKRFFNETKDSIKIKFIGTPKYQKYVLLKFKVQRYWSTNVLKIEAFFFTF